MHNRIYKHGLNKYLAIIRTYFRSNTMQMLSAYTLCASTYPTVHQGLAFSVTSPLKIIKHLISIFI